MSKETIVVLVATMLGTGMAAAEIEWSGYCRQAYHERSQLFNPTEIRPWLSDAVSSATTLANEKGPVTEVMVVWDWDWPGAVLSAGLFGRAVWYANATYQYLLVPQLQYRGQQFHFQAGRQPSCTWGGGLMLGNYPVSGAALAGWWNNVEVNVFYHALLERSGFQREAVHYGGFSGTWNLLQGKLGLLYTYDNSPDFTDAGRRPAARGSGMSLQGEWEWDNYWHIQGEAAWLAGAAAFFGGLDVPILDYFSFQARLRYLDEGFLPLLSPYAREGKKQTHFYARLPWFFFSEQLVITPQWGLKHTPDENYWLPGLQVRGLLWDTIWWEGGIYAEQPAQRWGDYRHYEYTEVKLAWMVTEQWYLDLSWAKTFNGFLDWKEIRTESSVEYKW
ncbi:hypothetical protein JW933_03920 [candidate division FCPU426 bacterium]|nr:hypothetical protein [candidate division FCPU426 bacterium]